LFYSGGNVLIGTATSIGSGILQVNGSAFIDGNILQLDNDKHLFGTTDTDLQISSDGTNPVYNSTGVHTFYNSTGLGTIRYGSALTSTQISKDINVLETFKLGSELYNLDGSINHTAFGYCYRQIYDADFSRPVNITDRYKTIKYNESSSVEYNEGVSLSIDTEITKNIYESYGEPKEVIDDATELINYLKDNQIPYTITEKDIIRTIYPYTKLTDVVDLTCEQAQQRQALALINQNVNLYDNITDFETGIMAENIYTQSKVINLLENYALKFLNITLLNNKLTHKNKETLILPDREENVLNVEDRIVDLEGAFSDHMFCMYAHKNYKDYRDCMLNVNPKNISSSH